MSKTGSAVTDDLWNDCCQFVWGTWWFQISANNQAKLQIDGTGYVWLNTWSMFTEGEPWATPDRANSSASARDHRDSWKELKNHSVFITCPEKICEKCSWRQEKFLMNLLFEGIYRNHGVKHHINCQKWINNCFYEFVVIINIAMLIRFKVFHSASWQLRLDILYKSSSILHQYNCNQTQTHLLA